MIHHSMHKCSHELKPCHISYIFKTNKLWITQTELPSGYPVHQPRGGGRGKNDNNENNENNNNDNDNENNKTTLLTKVGKIQQK